MATTIFGESYVLIDPVKLAGFIRANDGPVVRRMIEDGEKVKVEARRLVGKRTHNLESRILKRVGDIGGNPAVFVGVENVPYALFHHEGTRPHIIRARRANYLRFVSSRTGKVVYTKQVNHPGTKPNRFLVNALQVLSHGV